MTESSAERDSELPEPPESPDPSGRSGPPEPGPRSGYELVIVANRLPVDRQVADDGSVTWQPSPGGLVAALEPVMEGNTGAWVGWTGDAGDAPEPFDARGIHLVPVPLSATDVQDFYEGMSNSTLWPLYHDVVAAPEFHRHWWDAYVRVNRRFAESAAAQAATGALVWVQDYQLQLVPQLLRKRRSDLRIGFFNHIPFPPYELFAQLPWRRQVLDGLLGADQLGFQRPADANNFLRACRRNGLITRSGLVQLPADPRFGSPEHHPRREVRAAAFPISIDSRRLDRTARQADVQARAREIRHDLGDPDVLLLGVDRLDYTKGILHRLKAVGELFESGELEAGKAVMVQVATPSRDRVEQYQQMRREVEETVGRINGDVSLIGVPAVQYLHHAYPREELSALYLAADVLLVTALRDGMNLVAKEYVASRHDERGALVLSEFAGAAIELPQSFLVNPHDIDGMKAAVMSAVRISERDAARRMRAMRRRVFEYDVRRWAATFLQVTEAHAGQPGDLDDPQGVRLPSGRAEPAGSTGSGGEGEDPAVPGGRYPGRDRGKGLPPDLVHALEEFSRRQSLLVGLDFDGVLAPLVADPAQARALPSSRREIGALAQLPGVRVALISGRSLADLRRVAEPPPGVLMVGSHGAEILDPDRGEPRTALPERATALLERVVDEMTEISLKHEGTRVELKPTSAVLHTRQAARDVAGPALRAAIEGPARLPGTFPTEGKEVLEIAVVETGKGIAVQRLRSTFGPDAVLYAGDDVTDENAFEVLDDDNGDVTVKVGAGDTLARHRLASPADVAVMLALLVDLCRES